MTMHAPQRTASRFATARVGTSVKASAQKTILMGDPGSGKTHHLSEYEQMFFLPVEGGTTGFSPSAACHFFELENEAGYPIVPRSLAELIEMIRRFREINVPAAGEKRRPYAHLALDSVSAIEDLVHAEVCRQNGVRSLEDSEYGPKLYNATIPIWRQFLAELDAVVALAGASVWLTGHTEEETAANQAGQTFRRKTLRIKGGGKSQSDVRGVLVQWADNLWLLTQQVTVAKGGKGQRTTASAGARVILTQPGEFAGGGSYEAKSRIRVPLRIPAAQEDVRAAMRAGVTRPAARVRADLETVIAQLPPEQAAEIRADVGKSDAPGWLDRTLSRAKAVLVALAADQEDEDPEQTPADPAAPTHVEPTEAPATKAEQKAPVPLASTATPPAPKADEPPREGESEAMRKYRLRLAQATTNTEVGQVAVDSSKDGTLTPDERRALTQDIQARRQELR
jgi:hypothetical protein